MNIIQQSHSEHGQTMVEYGFILLLVAIAAILALAAIGPELSTIFGSVASHI